MGTRFVNHPVYNRLNSMILLDHSVFFRFSKTKVHLYITILPILNYKVKSKFVVIGFSLLDS